MRDRRVLFAAVIVAAAVTAAAAGRSCRDFSDSGRGALHGIAAARLLELPARLSAFTGITYWLFSGTAGLFAELSESGLWGILRALPDIEIRNGAHGNDAPGAYTL